MNITIKKLPSFNSAKRLTTNIPSNLTDKQLLNTYAKVVVVLNAHKYNKLSDDYFNSALTATSSGFTPKDMWLNSNLQTTKEDLWEEIKKKKFN